jgi:7,8-dihydroneopterin aldolase/epimerase/oxygenase
MLTIVLSRVEFDGRHGNTAVERRATRKFEVDVELDVDGNAAEQSDRLVDTVDYSAVAELIVGVGTSEPHHLLESLARRMVDAVRRRFPGVKRVRLELRKLNPPTCAGHPAYSAARIDDRGGRGQPAGGQPDQV